MKGVRAVIDTNVLVSGLRSRAGTSFRLLSLLGSGKFVSCVSVPLAIEYEKALLGAVLDQGFTRAEIEGGVDYVCAASERLNVFFLWRPVLRDLKDDMLLELAVAGRCRYIVTFNLRHFIGIDQFGIQAIAPRDFLRRIGDRP